MAISEAARADLYTGLAELLGRDRAETLMAYLPTFEPTDVATKADLAELRDLLELRFGMIDRRLESIDRRFDSIDRRFDSVDRRFEAMEVAFSRLYLTLVTGLFVIVATMVGLIVAR